MGNGLSPCLQLPATAPTAARLVYWGGRTRMLLASEDGDRCCSTAGDVVAELLPADGGHVVCPADCFFVGLPIPVMSPGERLLPGWTYFVLPAARFSCFKVLTAAALAVLSPGKKKVPLAGPGQCPFEYVKGDGGAALIRVLPEFIEKVITSDDSNHGGGRRGSNKHKQCRRASLSELLCSTPELKRHYAQLVGPRSQPWSPGLETISECNKRRILRSSTSTILSSRLPRTRACALTN